VRVSYRRSNLIRAAQFNTAEANAKLIAAGKRQTHFNPVRRCLRVPLGLLNLALEQDANLARIRRTPSPGFMRLREVDASLLKKKNEVHGGVPGVPPSVDKVEERPVVGGYVLVVHVIPTA
jgi:hypothetical protein